MDKLNIAIAGFHHETNTFAGKKAFFEDFERADGWPKLSLREAIFTNLAKKNIPISGFIDAARKQQDWQLIPLLWCNAPPSSYVDNDAFEKVVSLLINNLKQQKKIDAIYLDLHGAMVSEKFEDGEAELLRRIRKVVGNEVPIVVSLDLHANVSNDMVDLSDLLVAFRTYPHIDMYETGERTASLLKKILDEKKLPHKAFLKTDYLIPITSQYTGQEPAISIYNKLDLFEKDSEVLSCSFTFGFPPADIYECGPAILVYSFNKAKANKIVREIKEFTNLIETKFITKAFNASDAVAFAEEHTSNKPVILVDTCDNPGAGTASDTVDILECLVAKQVKNAVVACICDGEAADLAHAAGVGKTIKLNLGGKSQGNALSGEFYIEVVKQEPFIATGPMYKGNLMDLGKVALLKIGGVRVIVISRKVQAADQAIFKNVGIDPAKQDILALKSSVHFRADFENIASMILIVYASGANIDNPELYPYKRLRRGVRLRPGGKVR